MGRAWAETSQGRLRVARRHAEIARQLAHRHHALVEEAYAFDLSAHLAELAGDREAALAAGKAGVVVAERSGNHKQLAGLLERLSSTQLLLGRVEQARTTAMRALELARLFGGRAYEADAELLLGRSWVSEDAQAAEAHLVRGVAIASQLDFYRGGGAVPP